jgi:uncharacterized membrane protein
MHAGRRGEESEDMDTSAPAAAPPRPASPAQLAWLTREAAHWASAGVVTDEQAATIVAGYRAVRRWSLAALGLWLGAGFVGVGILWLVAANLDRFAPLGRFVAVALLWLGSVAAAELAARRSRTLRSPVVGGLRGLAALLYGAVVMQAAQSLQVPAFDATLIGVWALGSLVYAYAVRGLAPLVVGIVLGSTWLVWSLGDRAQGPFGVLLAFGALGAAGFALARLHHREPGGFAATWRLTGAGAALVALFAASLPWGYELTDAGWLGWTAVTLGVALAAVASVRARGLDLLEATAGAFVLVPALGIGVWSSHASGSDEIGAGDVTRAAIAVLVFAVAAAAVAAVGVLRDEPHLTWLAVLALTAFTTVQAFAVFAEVITGAWLFLALGVVFAVTGWVADRGRREMAAALEGPSEEGTVR